MPQAGPGDVGGVVDRCRGSAPHHTVLSTAVDTEQLVDFAKLLGVELLIIDGSTNRRDFADRDLLEPGALPPLPRSSEASVLRTRVLGRRGSDIW